MIGIYNQFGESTTYEATVSGTAIYAANYTRDALGRITEKSETIDGTTVVHGYTYDTVGRLDEVYINSTLVRDYDYDSNGNRTAVDYGSGSTSGTYDDQDRLLTYGGNTYTYNDNGELETKVAGTATTTYDYDAFGNLLSVDLPGGTTVSYIVDPKNRRVGRSVNG